MDVGARDAGVRDVPEDCDIEIVQVADAIAMSARPGGPGKVLVGAVTALTTESPDAGPQNRPRRRRNGA